MMPHLQARPWVCRHQWCANRAASLLRHLREIERTTHHSNAVSCSSNRGHYHRGGCRVSRLGRTRAVTLRGGSTQAPVPCTDQGGAAGVGPQLSLFRDG